MNDIIDGLEQLIYVIDADTKQIIRRNFKYNGWTNPKGEDGNYNFSILLGGVLKRENQRGVASTSIDTIRFDESQITDLGYDFSSIKGNNIESFYDPEFDAYFFPSVAIISMSKLK